MEYVTNILGEKCCNFTALSWISKWYVVTCVIRLAENCISSIYFINNTDYLDFIFISKLGETFTFVFELIIERVFLSLYTIWKTHLFISLKHYSYCQQQFCYRLFYLLFCFILFCCGLLYSFRLHNMSFVELKCIPLLTSKKYQLNKIQRLTKISHTYKLITEHVQFSRKFYF